MNGILDRKILPVLAALLLVTSFAVQAETGTESEAVDAEAAFEMLKGLAGSWVATGPEGEGQQAPHEFRLASAGTVVMETMYGGTDHEMINMYHLDGDDLVLTHYCAGGNQPHMKLDRASASRTKLRFDFAGGTNLDPATDEHIHAAAIAFLDDGRVESSWIGYSEGEEAGTMTLALARKASE